MRLTRDELGNRLMLWPIQLRWSKTWLRQRRRFWWSWIGRHFVEVGAERTPDGSTVSGHMPGLRGVCAQVWHFGPLRVLFGRTEYRGTVSP